MPSLIPAFEYDIFVSYRQKDNKGDRWVTEFVDALKVELEATFKEDVSVYFDTDPHDGLLETHSVDKSLEGKLKSLIFIPIVSQTYCDPASFAWRHELCEFNRLAKGDPFGRDVKLSNGNVASRILPVKIHEIDAEDKTLLESELGGALRAIDFIYREAGVNRPLKSNDNKKDNLNRTDYRNQVNKVANAIKEIISTLRQPATSSALRRANGGGPSGSRQRKMKGILALITTCVIASLGYFGYSNYNNQSIPTSIEVSSDRSIAVLPFVNMSNDPEQEYFSDGISEELINALAKMPNLKVTGRTSSFSYKGKNEKLHVIGKELGVNTILEGSVRKSGNTLRITAQLINAQNGFHLWTETYDRELTEVFRIQDEITEAIMNQLKIQLNADQRKVSKASETSLDAYETYMKARQELARRGDHLYVARKMFERVIQLDPNYSLAYSGLGITLTLIPSYFPVSAIELMELAKRSAEKAIALNPDNAEAYSVVGIVMAFYEWKWQESEEYFQKSYAMSPNDTEIVNFLGDFYLTIWHPDGIETEAKALALDPLHPIKYSDLARAQYVWGNWAEGLQLGKHFHKLEPDILAPFGDIVLAHCALGQYSEAELLIAEYPRTDNAMTNILLKYLTAWISIAKGDNKKAAEMIPALEKATNDELLSPSFLGLLYLKFDAPEKAAEWLEHAYQVRDYWLIFDFRITLPENISDHPAVRKALDKPELNALFELRRKNLKLKPGNRS